MVNRSTGFADAHISQKLTLVVGVVYTLIGLVGFIITGFDDFAEVTGETLLGLEINPLHNLVHLAVGLLGLAMWRRLDSARSYGWILAGAFAVVFLYGLVAVGDDDLNFLSLNTADNLLHLLTAAVGAAIGVLASRPAPGAARPSTGL